MKLLLTAFCAAMITSPLAFAGDKCEKKCDEGKEESTLVAGKDCDKKCGKEKAEEETLVAAEIAHCGKCEKDKGCEDCKECKDGAKCEDCDKCKKHGEEKEEGSLIAGEKCKKKCNKEEKEEATLA